MTSFLRRNLLFIIAGIGVAMIVTSWLLTNDVFGSFQGANISDSTYRYAAIENEDIESWNLYRTLNGTTEQVNKTDYGFDNSTELIDVLNNQKMQEELTQELEQTNQVMQTLIVSVQKLTQTLQQLAAQFISSVIPNQAFATAVTIEDPGDLSDVHIRFNASFANGTIAKLDQNITRTQGDLLVTLLNGVVSQKIDPDKLQNLDLGMELPEEETEEESDDGDGSGGSGSGSGSGGGGSGGGDIGPIDLGLPGDPGLNAGINYDCDGDLRVDRTYPCDDPTIKPMKTPTGGDEGGSADESTPNTSSEPQPQPEPEPEQQQPEPDTADQGGDESGDGGSSDE